VTAIVTNVGQTAGTADVTIGVDGSNAVRGIVDLEQGESRQFTHTVAMDQSDIDVAVSSQDTEQRTTIRYDDGVEQTPTATPSATPELAVETTPPPQQQGGGTLPLIIGSVVAVVLLSGAAVLGLRWY
jgi:hypothetical protein